MKTLSKALMGTVAAGMMAATAAPAMAQDWGRNDRWDNRDYGRDYGRGNDWRSDNPREAVAQCSRVAERDARRRGYDFADVTTIRSVRDTRGGFVINGRIAVRDGGHWNRHDRRDDRWRGGYRDGGQFTCRIDRGRVVDMDYFGIRGM